MEFNCNATAEYLLSQAQPPIVYPLPINITLKPHEFKNATIPQGQSIWTVPPTAASPVSKFQITVRDINGSVVAVRAVAISQTTFKITSPLAISGVSIFVNPIETST
jgi:hypothetical protein